MAPLRPLAGGGVPGEVAEEVGHQVRHLLLGENRRPDAGLQLGGGGVGDQPFQHRAVDELEPAAGPGQQGSRPDRVGGLLVREPQLCEPGKRLLHGRGQLVGVDGAAARVRRGPQPEGEGAAGLQPIVCGQHRPAVVVRLPVDLVGQPVLDDLPVELGRSDPVAAAPLRLVQLGVRQFRDERQHARVAGQPQQVLDLTEPDEPARRPRLVPGVQAGEEVADLAVGEVLQRDDPDGVPAAGGGQQGAAELVVVAEVLGAAGQHDLRLAGRLRQQRAQVAGRRVVADPLHQLVEAVQQQRHPAPGDQVPDLVVGDVPDVQLAQVLADQVDQAGALVQAVQLQQQRLDRADPAGQRPDHFTHQERLAPPEVAQHGDEPGAVLAQPAGHRGQHVLLDPRAGSPGVRAAAAGRRVVLPEPLRHVHFRQVPSVTVEPLARAPPEPVQVDQAAVLGQAVQPDPRRHRPSVRLFIRPLVFAGSEDEV